ncbi:MAG: hypothetical protein RL131_1411, partial [Bacteroidota bacterium]
INQYVPEHQEILNYMDGTIDSHKKRVFEEQLTEDTFLGEAIEGLQSISTTSELNALHHSVRNAWQRKLKRRSPIQRFIYPTWMLALSIGLILALILAGYWIISLLLNN